LIGIDWKSPQNTRFPTLPSRTRQTIGLTDSAPPKDGGCGGAQPQRMDCNPLTPSYLSHSTIQPSLYTLSFLNKVIGIDWKRPDSLPMAGSWNFLKFQGPTKPNQAQRTLNHNDLCNRIRPPEMSPVRNAAQASRLPPAKTRQGAPLRARRRLLTVAFLCCPPVRLGLRGGASASICQRTPPRPSTGTACHPRRGRSRPCGTTPATFRHPASHINIKYIQK